MKQNCAARTAASASALSRPHPKPQISACPPAAGAVGPGKCQKHGASSRAPSHEGPPRAERFQLGLELWREDLRRRVALGPPSGPQVGAGGRAVRGARLLPRLLVPAHLARVVPRAEAAHHGVAAGLDHLCKHVRPAAAPEERARHHGDVGHQPRQGVRLAPSLGGLRGCRRRVSVCVPCRVCACVRACAQESMPPASDGDLEVGWGGTVGSGDQRRGRQRLPGPPRATRRGRRRSCSVLSASPRPRSRRGRERAARRAPRSTGCLVCSCACAQTWCTFGRVRSFSRSPLASRAPSLCCRSRLQRGRS